MRKIVSSILMLLAVGVAARAAVAAQFWSSNTNLKVSQVSIESDSDTLTNSFMLFDAAPSGVAHNCNSTNGWWAMGGDQAAVDSMRATALAAKLADRPVRVKWISGNSGFTSCSGGGGVGYPMARGLILQ